MPKRKKKVPSYCLHKASGKAVVRLDGKDHYLADYGSRAIRPDRSAAGLIVADSRGRPYRSESNVGLHTREEAHNAMRRFLMAATSVGLLGAICGLCLSGGPLSNAPDHPQAAVASLAERYARRFPGVPHVTVDEARALIAQSRAVLVDVRLPRERAVSRIPGSITPEELGSQRRPGRIVIPYCTIGYRSGRQARRLRQRGFDARNLHGGILAWSHGGLPLEAPDGSATRRLHTYSATWSLAPAGYQAVH